MFMLMVYLIPFNKTIKTTLIDSNDIMHLQLFIYTTGRYIIYSSI